MEKEQFRKKIEPKISELDIKPEILRQIQTFMKSGHFWEVANILGQYYNREQVTEDFIVKCREIISEIRDFKGQLFMTVKSPTLVVFGTSGWRGVIGEDYTLYNIHKVLRAIIELLKTDTYLEFNGFKSFAEVQSAGILIQRDNRFMGDHLLEAARKELTTAGIKVYDAGECPTGVGSALVKEMKMAGSCNFTPSHNPMEYAGIKFNPADGGGSEKNLTSIIEEKANKLMGESSFSPVDSVNEELLEKIDGGTFFKKFIEEKSLVFDLLKIRNWLLKNKEDFYLVIDYMHGSSRGYVEALIGEDIFNELRKSKAILELNKNDDFSFHGLKPEPSAFNQKPLMQILQKNKRKYSLALAMDPDADRIRFSDSMMDVEMNSFAAIAYYNQLFKGLEGGVVSSAPSSDFVLKIAKDNNQPVVETAVGFKNFRQAFGSGNILMGFEESDGISFKGHTLEKCAMAGFLAALDALSLRDKNLSEQFLELQKKYGFYYPGRAGADVKGVSVEEWQNYKKAVVDVLQNKMFSKGQVLDFNGVSKQIEDINTIDGVKIILDDGSWILLRPSGTEPKFRYYYEITSEKALENPKEELDKYHQKAQELLKQARELVKN